MSSLDHPIFTESIARIRRELEQRAARDQALARALQRLTRLEREVLERCIHSCGDVSIAADLVFAPSGADASAAPDPAEAASSETGVRPPTVLPVTVSPASVAPQTPAPESVTGTTEPHPTERAREEGACAQALAALRAGAPILADTAMAAAALTPMARRTLGVPVHSLLDWAPAEAPPGSTRSAAAVASAWASLTRTGPAPLVLIGSAPTALERLLDLVVAGARPPSLLVGMPVGFVGVAESKRRLAASGLPQIRLEGSRGGAALAAAALNALLRRAALDQAAAPE